MYVRPDDWDLASTGRANTLLVGREDATRATLEAGIPQLDGPVYTIRAGDPLPPASHGGSLVLLEVCHLSLVEQHRLVEWLDENAGRTRIISTSSRSLAPMIAAGEFLAVLYYRLNLVYIEMTPP